MSSFISFWIPGVAMVIFYSLVMKKAYHLENNEFAKYKSVHHSIKTERKLSRPMSHDSSNVVNLVNSVNASVGAGGHRSSQDLAKHWRREYRLIKTLGIVITLFTLCWVFFFLRYTLTGFGILPDWITKNMVLEDILFWIGYFNSALNPFLYNYTNRDFRKAFRDLLRLRKSVDLDAELNNNSAEDSEGCCCFMSSRKNRLQSVTSSQPSNSRKATIDETRISLMPK